MGTVYVREQGAVVRRDGERLRVTLEHKELSAIPLVHLSQLALIGNVQLTTPAAALLLERDIDVVYMSTYGKFRGRLVRNESKMAQLRHQQMRIASDARKGVGLMAQYRSITGARALLSSTGAAPATANRCSTELLRLWTSVALILTTSTDASSGTASSSSAYP